MTTSSPACRTVSCPVLPLPTPSFASPPAPVGDDRVVRPLPPRVLLSSNSYDEGHVDHFAPFSWGAPFKHQSACMALLKSSFQTPVSNSRFPMLGNSDKRHYFILGFYANPKSSGVTASAQARVSLAQQLNQWIRQCVPNMSWSSIAISNNTAISPHRDDNCHFSHNASFTLGSFQGGATVGRPCRHHNHAGSSVRSASTGVQCQ